MGLSQPGVELDENGCLLVVVGFVKLALGLAESQPVITQIVLFPYDFWGLNNKYTLLYTY